jgi:hypothetical protein
MVADHQVGRGQAGMKIAFGDLAGFPQLHRAFKVDRDQL